MITEYDAVETAEAWLGRTVRIGHGQKLWQVARVWASSKPGVIFVQLTALDGHARYSCRVENLSLAWPELEPADSVLLAAATSGEGDGQ